MDRASWRAGMGPRGTHLGGVAGGFPDPPGPTSPPTSIAPVLGRTRISLARLIAAKLLVVAIALVVDWVLQRWIPNADLIVAIGLRSASRRWAPRFTAIYSCRTTQVDSGGRSRVAADTPRCLPRLSRAKSHTRSCIAITITVGSNIWRTMTSSLASVA